MMKFRPSVHSFLTFCAATVINIRAGICAEAAGYRDLLFRFPVPVQTVAATPSGIKQRSKVVFMRPGRRFGLSTEQKCDVWRRWKAGQTLHEIGRAFGKDHNSIRGVVSRHG